MFDSPTLLCNSYGPRRYAGYVIRSTSCYFTCRSGKDGTRQEDWYDELIPFFVRKLYTV